MSKRVIIAGGGTGGHIFPAIAIANALKEHRADIDILFVGAKGKMEMEKVPQAGYKIQGLDIAGFNRSSLIKNMGLPLKLMKSFFQVRNIFTLFKPDAVIGVGGYSSFPVLRYAQAKGIPSFIHESNSFAGKSNQLLAKKATAVFVASEGMEKFFPAEKISLTGNPVRKQITQAPAPKELALAHFGLTTKRKTVLVVGGSLGARSINEAIAAGMQKLLNNELQLIWQTGKLFGERAAQMAANEPFLWANDFIDRMDLAYAAADIVIARSGAMTIAELCVAQKPVIFVPYPFAAEDHQTANAMYLLNKEAALMVPDSKVASDLLPTLLELAVDEEKQRMMKEHIGQLAVRDADEQVAGAVLKALGL